MGNRRALSRGPQWVAGESLGFQGLREEGGLWSSTCVQIENLLGAEKGVLRAPPSPPTQGLKEDTRGPSSLRLEA